MKLLIATFLLSGVFSAPFNSLLNTPETKKCDKEPSRFHTKKTLVYEYEGETISGLVGTSDVRSGLKLTAKCLITPVSPCVFKLKITDAELLESQSKIQDSLDFKLSPGSAELRRELLAHELYFESHGGVMTSLRPAVAEPMHILNMKRGILSAFQLKHVNTDKAVNEVDVNGECSADYQIESRHASGRVKTIVKSKDLGLCNDRSKTNLGIPVTPYATDKPISLLKSKSLCKFHLSPRSRLESASCQETHLFRPFSSGYNSSSGAMTTVRQTVKLVGRVTVTATTISIPENKKTLKYEHSKQEEISSKNDREVRSILEKLAAEDSAKPDSARLFTRMIFAVRRLNMKALQSIWYRYYECMDNGRCTKEKGEKFQKFIVDALTQCGTLDCAQFMVTIISDKKVGTQQSVAFLTGIALVGKPSEDMVGNILYFCQETPSRTAFLTLGTLIHKYCQQHACDNLSRRSPIYQADTFLQRKLRQDCQTSAPEDIDKITLALKAIGNAGRPSTAVPNMLKCAVQTGPTVINVEALQALRRIPCSDKMTTGLLKIFDDLTIDTEVRIEAYLALMRCPSETVIKRIADVLDNEENKQVGSFVWSHLTNALESTEPLYGVPLRDIISKALGERKLRVFNLDHLRFSHAYEVSGYSYRSEMGGSSQAQVIFHPDSFFPRSAKFNLTVDMLGASINLLETAARFEGFETLVEQMFGTEGYFPDEHLMKLLKIRPTSAAVNPRGRRDVENNEMDRIKSNLEKLQDKMKIERKNPSGALSFKVFGHELQFLNFEDIDWLQGEADSINVIDTLINIARGGKVTYTKSFMFLEADHEIPTSLGLPLKLAVNGSLVGSLTLKGKFDIRNMFWGKKKLDIRGFVTPSAVVEISGKMSVDAKHATSGIHVNSSLYTSTEINGNATYKEGEGIKLSIDPPTKPIYIVNITSNLATFLNDKSKRIIGSPRRIERQQCANLTSVLGVKLCGHISSPLSYRDYNAPYFPLSGESSFGLVFQTTNVDRSRFELEGRKLTSEDENRYDWIFNMHIPGLTLGRTIEANSTFQFLENGKYLGISAGIHGYKLGRFEASYNNFTNGFHTKFSSPELAYLKPITIETEIFNKTNPETNEQDIGISMNATYNNFTIQEVVTLFKHNDQYGFQSNLTYWPRKHITTEARFSLQKRSVFMKVDDTSSKSKLLLAGKLGKTTNKFYVKLGNEIMNYELKMNGEVNIKHKKFLLDVFTKPSRNLLKFEAYPRENDIERGFYMRLLHVNSSSHLTGYLGSSYSDSATTLKFNGVAMKQPFHLHATHRARSHERTLEMVATGFGYTANSTLGLISDSDSVGLEYFASLNDKTMSSKVILFKHAREMGVNFNAAVMEKTVDVLAEYFEEDQKNGFRLKLSGAGEKINSVATYFTNAEENGLDFRLEGMHRTARSIWTYYNLRREYGLKMNASVLDKSMEASVGIFTRDNEKGLRVGANVLKNEMEARWSVLSGGTPGVKFAATAFKKNMEVQSTVLNSERIKEWRIDSAYDGMKTSLVNTYRPHEMLLCSELTGLKKVSLKLCSQLIKTAEETALRLSAESFGRKAEVKASLIQSGNEKGFQLQVRHNDALLSDVFGGIVTSPSYNGLRFRGNVKEKSFDALLKYTNTQLKRSVDLDLRVQGNQVSFETALIHEPALRGVQFNVMHQNRPVGTVFALLVRKPTKKILKFGMKTTDNNGAEYKLSVGKSRIEKKLSSLLIVTLNHQHYKYGWSVSYTNKGTAQESNHQVTTKIHYSTKKTLTLVYHLVNTAKNFNLLSKTELAPGQFINNKLAYSKTNKKLEIQYEFLPGMGMSFDTGLVNNRKLLGLLSSVTILGYPMNSSIILNRELGQLNCKFSYCPVRPPVDVTAYFRMLNVIDMGAALSAFDITWGNRFLIDLSSKQMKLSFDLLPKVPVTIFAKLLDKNQFVFNVTTCSGFSVELAGTRASNDDYQLLMKHQYKDIIYEDFRVTVYSLQDIYHLRLKLEAKLARELLRRMDKTMWNLFDNILSRLANVRALLIKKSEDVVDYMRADGKHMLLMAVGKTKARVNILKALLQDVKMDELVEKYSSHANGLMQILMGDTLKLVNEIKTYGYPLVENFKHLKNILTEISSELLPHLRSFPLDVRSWLMRSLNRYKTVSIFGRTIDEMIHQVWQKSRVYYHMVAKECEEKVKLLTSKAHEIKTAFKEWEQVTKQILVVVTEFTCDYDVRCTLKKVQDELRKLVVRMQIQKRLQKMNERLEMIRERVLKEYKAIENIVSKTIKDKDLQQKVMKVLKPLFDFLKRVALSVKKNILPLQERELMNSLEDMAKTFATNIKTGKQNLVKQLQQTKQTFNQIIARALDMYEKLIKKMHELRNMSWKEMQVLIKNEMEINYNKLRTQVDDVVAQVVEKLGECLEQHAQKVETIKRISRAIYTMSRDVIDGRVTLTQAQYKIMEVVKKVLKLLEEQGKNVMDKIKDLKVKEVATKTIADAIKRFEDTVHDLKQRVKALYPKVKEELKNLLDKIKRIVVKYAELTKSRMDEVRKRQRVYIEKAVQKMNEMKVNFVKKLKELVSQYKSINTKLVEKVKVEIKRLIKIYEDILKNTVTEYKDKLTTFMKKVRQDVVDMVALYKDMPIGAILKDLRNKANVAVDKVLGFVIGEILSGMQTASEASKKLRLLYEENLKLVTAKWRKTLTDVNDLAKKYRALAEKKYQEASRYYNQRLQPAIKAYLDELKNMIEPLMAYSKIRFGRVQLWYEHVKHMKFKEFYRQLRELMNGWAKELEKCGEICMLRVQEWRAKVSWFLQEVVNESKNVVSRVQKVNELVKQDAVATFLPYEVTLKNVLNKYRDLPSEKMNALRNNYKKLVKILTEFKTTGEDFANVWVKKLKAQKAELVAKVHESLNQLPFLMDAMETVRSLKDGRLVTKVMQSLNNCPFINQVLTHELWPILKREFLDHEFVVASQQLRKYSTKKLRELSITYYSQFVSKLRELHQQLAEKVKEVKLDLSTRHKILKKHLEEKRVDIQEKLRNVHEKLLSKGEKAMDNVRDMHKWTMGAVINDIERFGDMSPFDVQVKVTEYVEEMIKPARSTYHDLLNSVEKQLHILAEKQHIMGQRADELRQKVMLLVADARKWYNSVQETTFEWTNHALKMWKTRLADLITLSEKLREDLELFSSKILVTGKTLIEEYVRYEDLLKMTPSQIIPHVKVLPMTYYESVRKLFASMRINALAYVHSTLQALKNFLHNMNMENFRRAKLQTEMGLEVVRMVLKDAGEQVHLVTSEILETAMFLQRFYGRESDIVTVYSRRPEFIEFVDYQIRHLVNCSRICATRGTKIFNETAEAITKLYSYGVIRVKNLLASDLPEMIENAQRELKQIDSKDFERVKGAILDFVERYSCNKTTEMLKTLYKYGLSNASEILESKLPNLIKYIRSEMKLIATENLEKLTRIMNIYVEKYYPVVREYWNMACAKGVEMVINQPRQKVEAYLRKYQIKLKLNLAKAKIVGFLNTVNKKVLMMVDSLKVLGKEQYYELLTFVKELEAKYPEISKYINADLIANLPTLLKNAYGRLPLVMNMVKRDFKTLVDNAPEYVRKLKLYLRNDVATFIVQYYTINKANLEKMLTQLDARFREVTTAFRKRVIKELPRVKQQIQKIIHTVCKTTTDFSSGELKLKLPDLDAAYKAILDMKALPMEKFVEIKPKILVLYKDTLKKVDEVIREIKVNAMTNWQKIKNTIPFYESKLQMFRQSSEKMLTSIRETLNRKMTVMKALGTQTLDACTATAALYYNKGKGIYGSVCKMDIGEVINKYTKMLSKKADVLVADIKIKASEMVTALKMNIQKLRLRIMEINSNIMVAVKYGKTSVVQKITQIYQSKKIKQYVDMEDLINKTMELSEDLYNLAPVQQLVRFWWQCYDESERLVHLTKESSEFALYVVGRLIKYNDVWEVVQDLLNPFHWVPPSNSIAMIFGRPHVHTFDGQYYEFVGYKKPSCTYVLAHDFRDKNFTLMSQETSLILSTMSGHIKIHASGKVEASVRKDAQGNEVNTVYSELPVDMMHVTVKREGSLVKISHDRGLDVTCNLKHFFCTFNVHRFYHGKLAGLLGTNNNEQYDEFMKPDKTIAKTVLEFANSWEVSGDPECKVASVDELKKPCSKKPSPRCKELFKNKSSPLAQYFKSLNPGPFYKACVFDTSDCNNNAPTTSSFCNVTAAYTALLREKGVWARQIPECESCGSKSMWQKWTQTGSKHVDVVLLVPETLSINTHAMNLPEFLRQLEAGLGKYKPRYAVVGFGGKSGVHQHPHIVTGSGKIFGKIDDVRNAILNMKFTSQKADAVEAIEYLSHLPFHPGASKVAILLTDKNREAISNISMSKAIKALDMQGVIFNVIGPYFQKQQHRDIIGLWKGLAYRMKGRLEYPLYSTISVPSDDYMRLAESSNGGVFNLKAYAKSHRLSTGALKKAMKTTLIRQLEDDQTYCRQCVCIPSWTAEPVTICRINRHARCT